MSRYDGLIIPRSYSEYINKTDAATLLQALQLSGVMDATPTENSNHPVKSGGIKSAIDNYLKCEKTYSSSTGTLDISNLPRGIYLCVFNNLYSSYEKFNIGILCNYKMSDDYIKYTTIANYEMTVTVSGSTITTNQARIYGARFYRVGYTRSTIDS